MTEQQEQSLVVDRWGKVDLVHYEFQATRLRGQALRQFSRWLVLGIARIYKDWTLRTRAKAKAAPRGVAWRFIEATSNRGPRQV
ncbi:MAG: hypothetical protein ACX931_15505 [Saccharospirillum sp.]